MLVSTRGAVVAGLLGFALIAQSQELSSFTISPNPVYGGGTTSGTLNLNAAAGSGGANVGITTNTSVLTVPASVTIPEGFVQGKFQISVGHIGAPATRQVTATRNAVTKIVNVLLRPGLKTVTLSPALVSGGDPTTGTVTLWAAAAAGGVVVSLSSNSSVVVPQAQVTVLAGATTANFNVTTGQVGANAQRAVLATLGGLTKTAIIQLTAQPRLQSFAISPASVLGGNPVTATATLNGVATGGPRFVYITESSANASVPSPVTIATSTASASVQVTTVAVGASETVVFSAKQGGVTRTAALTILPPSALMSLGVSPNNVEGGTSTTGTVTLSSAAPAGGKTVTLSDNSTALTTPASAVVSAGTSSKTFTIGTTSVSSTVTRQVTATLDGITKTANVTVKPPAPTVQVSLSGSVFNPQTITVSPGTKIKWTNQDFSNHTVTRDRTDIDGPTSVTLFQNDSYEWTVPLGMPIGTDVYYHCQIHGFAGNGTSFGIGMVGKIQVR